MTKRLAILGLAVLLATSVAAWGKPTPTVTVTITALDSTGSLVESPAAQGGGAAKEWFYDFTTTLETFDIIFPESICTSGGGTTYAGSLTVTMGSPGNGGNIGTVSSVTQPTPLTFTGDSCQTVAVEVAASTPVPYGQYSLNRIWSVSSNSTGFSPSVVGKGLHIHMGVTGDPVESIIKCQITSSDYNFLNDCNGNPVNADSLAPNAGTFVIQANNKKVETSTNPGQFYYNVFWWNNTGSDQTVSVNFDRSKVIYTPGGDVVSTGANAIHAMVFPTFQEYGYLDPSLFVQVNQNEPYGSNDSGIGGVLVPAGSVLWADYHIQWGGINKPDPPTAHTSCQAANQAFTVTANVVGNAIGTFTCTAGATGYIGK